MLSFSNTEIAFRIKTSRELRKAYILFKAISNRTLVGIGGGFARLAIRVRIPIGWIVKPTIYSHFCGGEFIPDCLSVVGRLARYNVGSVLDYSVEGREEDAEIEAALEETLLTVHNAAGKQEIPFAVFKPTAFIRSSVLEKKSTGMSLTEAEQRETEDFRKRVDRLCKTAFDKEVRIMIDAEDVCYQDYIDEVVSDMMMSYNKEQAIVFNTYQMYRHDRMDKFRQDLEMARNKGFFMGIKSWWRIKV